MKDRDEKGRFVLGNRVREYSDEEMNRFFDAYCVHRSNGRDKLSFSAKGCDYRVIDKWLSRNLTTEDETTVMQAFHARAEQAEAKGHDFWETLMFNVGFGIPMEINSPTKDDSTRKFIIDPKFTKPHILIFLMRSKCPAVYGDRVDRTRKTDLLPTGSTPCKIIAPNTKELVRASIGIQLGSAQTPGVIDLDADDYNAAMRVINESQE